MAVRICEPWAAGGLPAGLPLPVSRPREKGAPVFTGLTWAEPSLPVTLPTAR